MVSQEDLINENIVKRFAMLNSKDVLAHAYLFSGSAFVRKYETALGVTKLLNCKEVKNSLPCNQCVECKRIEDGNNPDIHIINNDSQEKIKIDQIRELTSGIKLRSFFGGVKVFIIRHCENLTIESSNALLKNLEEPSKDSLIILTTSKPEKMLPTIRSRCHQIHFESHSGFALESYLQEKKIANKVESHFLAFYAEGCLGRALDLKNNNTFDQKNDIIDQFILGGKDDSFLKKITADKDKTFEFLNVLLSWLRDSLLVKSNVEDKRLVHLDRVVDLKGFVNKYSFEELNDLYQQPVRTLNMLADNFNIKMPLLIIKEQL